MKIIFPSVHFYANMISQPTLKGSTIWSCFKVATRLLKEYASELAPALTLIFQASLDQSALPAAWKHAWVTLIFKKGERARPSNYRPISLTCIACKCLEHIIHSNIMDHLDNNAMLSDFQHGFRKKRSCNTQLIQTVHDLAKCLHDGEQIDAVLLDFSKAFDKVPHARLESKLNYYGIRENTLQWIKCFLSQRSQQVVLDGKTSASAPVTSWVPQGSVPGPLLFLCYINDLPSCVSSTPHLFADDCHLYRRINSPADAVILQQDLDRLQKWEADWLMQFNPDKCEVIRITNRRGRRIDSDYTIHGTVLREVSSAKYLGVTIDSKLTWNAHVANVTKKANNTQAFLQRNINRCPANIKETCYKTFVKALSRACLLCVIHLLPRTSLQ